MDIRLRDRLGLVVGIVLFEPSGSFITLTTYMCKDIDGVAWAYIRPDKKADGLVILNKNHTCAAGKLSNKSKAIIDGRANWKWTTLREHRAQLRERKKEERKKKKKEKKKEKEKVKKDKSFIVKRKHMKHIIANWVVDDL